MKRVAITGLGCITAIGQDVSTFSDNLFAGNSGLHDIEDVPSGELRFHRLASVKNFHAKDWVTTAQRNISERSGQFALAAARQALTQSGIRGAYDPSGIAVVLGCSTGGRVVEEEQIMGMCTRNARVHPLTVPRCMASSGTSLICLEHGLKGPAYTVSTACASGTHAIGQAFHMVRSGMVQAALTGAHEAPLSLGFLKAWDGLRVVSPAGCRPFAADRDGMTLGEGAAMLVLEDLDAAIARGATVLAEIVGFGMSSDAFHLTQGDPAGAAAAMAGALRDGNVDPAEVGYVNAHGTGTETNDRVEAEALHHVFGDRARTLPVSSTKGLHGHALGASGAIEALVTVLALGAQKLPATAGLENVDPALGLDHVLLANEHAETMYACSNSFAFGGLNAAIVFRRTDGAQSI